MRFYLETKNNNDCYLVAKEILSYLEANGLIYDEVNPELVISIGGDGTFIRAIHHFRSKSPLFIAINEGSLGYLCQFNDDEIVDLLELIVHKQFDLVKETRLLKAVVNNENYYAFNELRFEANNGQSLSFNLTIDNTLLERFVGDGICCATSVGSTGLNKGLGGAIIDPSLEAIQISEKAPINSRVYKTLGSPIVISKDSTITLNKFNKINFLFCYDNFSKNISLEGDTIKVELSNKKVSILMNKDRHFISKIHESFVK